MLHPALLAKQLTTTAALCVLALSVAQAQLSYDLGYKSKTNNMLKEYNNDQATQRAQELLTRFESGTVPTAEALAGLKTTGIVFVMQRSTDCERFSCSDMRVCGAAIDVQPQAIGYMGLEDKGPKRPLTEYVQLFLAREDVSHTPQGRWVAAQHKLPTSYLPYQSNGSEWVTQETSTSQSFIRQSGQWLIMVSTTSKAPNVLIFAFPIEGTTTATNSQPSPAKPAAATTATGTSQGYSPATRQHLEQLAQKERDRNEFSEMIEAIVNHPEVTAYYHNHDMFIVSNGLFRYDLEVKRQGRDMWILAMPLPDIKHYILFTSQNYDGETNHRVKFAFQIPTEGMHGIATFAYKKDKWVLTEMEVVE